MEEALVIYQYQTAGAGPGNKITIRSDEMDVNPNRAQTSPHMVGDTVTLQAEEEEEKAIKMLGKDPKEYVVRKCMHTYSPQTPEQIPKRTVYVIVADPDSWRVFET